MIDRIEIVRLAETRSDGTVSFLMTAMSEGADISVTRVLIAGSPAIGHELAFQASQWMHSLADESNGS